MALGNLGIGHYAKHSCANILGLDQLFRTKCLLKIFLIYSSGWHFVCGS